MHGGMDEPNVLIEELDNRELAVSDSRLQREYGDGGDRDRYCTMTMITMSSVSIVIVISFLMDCPHGRRAHFIVVAKHDQSKCTVSLMRISAAQSMHQIAK